MRKRNLRSKSGSPFMQSRAEVEGEEPGHQDMANIKVRDCSLTLRFVWSSNWQIQFMTKGAEGLCSTHDTKYISMLHDISMFSSILTFIPIWLHCVISFFRSTGCLLALHTIRSTPSLGLHDCIITCMLSSSFTFWSAQPLSLFSVEDLLLPFSDARIILMSFEPLFSAVLSPPYNVNIIDLIFPVTLPAYCRIFIS